MQPANLWDRVQDSTQAPYSAVGLLRMRWTDEKWYRGTAAAFQISVQGDSPGQWLLTCAHNLVAQQQEGNGYAEEVSFFPGYNRRTQAPAVPQGGIRADRCYYPTAYRDRNDPSWDVALLHLKTAIKPTPQFLFNLVAVNSIPGPFRATLTGYPGDNFGEMYTEQDDVIQPSDVPTKKTAPNTVAFTHGTWEGNSGSPIYYRDQKTGIYNQIAVHIVGPSPDAPPENNLRIGILLTSAINNWIARAISSDGFAFVNSVP